MRPRLPCKSVLLFPDPFFPGRLPVLPGWPPVSLHRILATWACSFPAVSGPSAPFCRELSPEPALSNCLPLVVLACYFPFPYSPLSLSVCSVFRWIFILQHANNNGVAFRKNSVPLSEKYPRQSPKHRAERPQAKRFLPPPFRAGSCHHGNVRGLNKASRARLCARIA